MKTISVKNWKGNEYKGEWNEKFYNSQIEGHDELFRIYVNNERCHITANEKEKLIGITSSDKTNEDNMRISLIKSEFEKLDKKAKESLLRYLQAIA